MLYFLIALLPYAAQILLIIHVVKTGRQTFWIFLILFVPYVGGIAYVIAELLPDLLHGGNGRAARSFISRTVRPHADIRRLENQLEMQNTVGNKLALAAAYAEAEQYTEAISLYRECLSGPYADDPAILFPLAQALYFSGQAAQAKKIIDTLKKQTPFDQQDEQLLDILVREASGENNISELESFYERSGSFEAGYYYVRALVRCGERKKAQEIVDEMKETMRRFKQFRNTMGRSWLSRSETELYL